jgi:hypothetical protein
MLYVDVISVLEETINAHVKAGLLEDKKILAIQKHDWNMKKLMEKELQNFRKWNLNLIGEAGGGKTYNIQATGTMKGIPVIKQMPGQYPDNSELKGMPEKITRNGRRTTQNVLPEFFPLPKLDDNGNYTLRKDGGIMIDYEAIKNYIVNYNDLLEFYNGDINQAPGNIFFWDEINRIAVQDVFQSTFQIFDEGDEFGNYRFPSGTIMMGACNPETGDYTVSPIFSDKAYRNRFIHLFVEQNIEGVNRILTKKKYDSRLISIVNQFPEIVLSRGEEWELDIQGSHRSVSVLESMIKHSDMENGLKDYVFQEVVAGMFGTLPAVNICKGLKEGTEKVPTGEELITDYEKVQYLVAEAVNDNRQDKMNQIKENFLNVIMEVENIEKLELVIVKDSEGNPIIPQNLNNIYLFFKDITAEFRVAIVKQLIENEKVHPIIAMHTELFELVKQDIKNSNRKS